MVVLLGELKAIGSSGTREDVGGVVVDIGRVLRLVELLVEGGGGREIRVTKPFTERSSEATQGCSLEDGSWYHIAQS